MKRDLHAIARAAAVAFMASACGGDAKKEPAAGPSPVESAPHPSAPAVASAAPSASPTRTPRPKETIGVPECDEYIRKYEACVRDHVPAAQKPMVEQALAQYRTTWRSAAAQPAARASLAGACQQALTTARASMTAYGCQW